MQSFDTKDSNTLESFDRKFESSDTFSRKDSEVEQSDIDFVESSDRKFENFDTEDSAVKQPDNDFVESFNQQFESSGEDALPDPESFGTEDSEMKRSG